MERLPSLAQQTDSINHLSSTSVAIDVSCEPKYETQQRRIPTVPTQFKMKKRLLEGINVYEPTIVSLGPYHHGKAELRRAEAFKEKALDMFIRSAATCDKSLFLDEIMKQIDEVMNQYDDQTLAEMMLRDGCFLLHYMETILEDTDKSKATFDYFTLCGIPLITHDLLLLENQIPLSLVKLLFTCASSKSDNKNQQSDVVEHQWDTLLRRFISVISCGDQWFFEETFWERDAFHILEILRHAQLRIEVREPRRVILGWLGWPEKQDDPSGSADAALYQKVNYQFRSTTDLRAKGIHIKADDANRISFTSYPLYGELKLPPWFVTENSLVLFSNIIAYEITSPNLDMSVTAYVNFMKSLIESTKDVKELREKGVLFGNLGGDDEVFKLFKDIATLGWDQVELFSKLKVSIVKHCSSKRKTWLAEFVMTYFRNPWTAIALLAAFILLCLTVVQTIFTIHPASS